jgi:hypothetical protein
VFLTTGLNSLYGNVPIGVFNLASGTFGAGLPAPRKVAENRYYAGGATYFRPLPSESACTADINNDGMVDGNDLSFLLADWGTSLTRSDLDRDGLVTGSDFGPLLASWGPCPN